MSERVRRVNELMRQILGEALGEMTDPGLGFVTVTSVDCTRDFEHATVYVSVLGNERQAQALRWQALERATRPLQARVGREVTPAAHAAAALRVRRDVRQGHAASSDLLAEHEPMPDVPERDADGVEPGRQRGRERTR